MLRAPFCGLTLTSLQRLFGEDHVTPVPVLLERALREPDPESAASQTPVQGSLFDAPPAVREDEAGPRARRGRGLRRPAARCWRRLGGPALYTGLSVANDAESLFQLVERLAPHDRHGRAGSRHRAAVRRA